MGSQALEYAIYDVFTTNKYCGNPLAIVYLDRIELRQEQKLMIAKEFNLSETVFMHERQGSECSIDIFMVDSELPFAGHPTIGSAISFKHACEHLDSAKLITKAGPIPITYEHDSSRESPGEMRATASIPHDVRGHKDMLRRKDLSALQPSLQNVPNLPESFPVVSIVKGMTFALIRLDSTTTLENVAPASRQGPQDFVKLDDGWPVTFIGMYFYVIDETRSTSNKIVAHCRMIEALLEDPATGSAACALAAHLALAAHAVTPRSQAFSFEFTQGEQMGRRSNIGVAVDVSRDGQIEGVRLSGSAVKVMAGSLTI